ncbi:hypothetical protein H4P12_07900 [Paracoccus sp. 11-3]|uniref:TonB family protein n=1 Tax=Paracoccus amoyensis TaxID=2760093 RepID=A0A926J5V9_9RHOB|nr:hypothetical protein [Paracoccus amoyensis]MBC9246637.1 hypothetical protein [Paracoccus amoyensis]
MALIKSRFLTLALISFLGGNILPAFGQQTIAPEQAQNAQPQDLREWTRQLSAQLAGLPISQLMPELKDRTQPLRIVLRLKANPNGHIRDVTLNPATGRVQTDLRIIMAVRDLSPLPAFSADMGQEPKTFILPMVLDPSAPPAGIENSAP